MHRTSCSLAGYQKNTTLTISCKSALRQSEYLHVRPRGSRRSALADPSNGNTNINSSRLDPIQPRALPASTHGTTSTRLAESPKHGTRTNTPTKPQPRIQSRAVQAHGGSALMPSIMSLSQVEKAQLQLATSNTSGQRFTGGCRWGPRSQVHEYAQLWG